MAARSAGRSVSRLGTRKCVLKWTEFENYGGQTVPCYQFQVSTAVFPVQQFNECTFRKIPGLRGICPAWRRLLWKRFPTPIGQTISLLNANTPACAGPLISKIQFNGVGGLPTHIRLNPNGDVFA
jgi:hypothetical protein